MTWYTVAVLSPPLMSYASVPSFRMPDVGCPGSGVPATGGKESGCSDAERGEATNGLSTPDEVQRQCTTVGVAVLRIAGELRVTRGVLPVQIAAVTEARRQQRVLRKDPAGMALEDPVHPW